MTSPAPKADRFSNRAPRGGAISPVNGVFYLGGQWMPMVAVEFKPGPVALMGSSRQVLWAARLRKEELARLDDEIGARLLFLNSPIKAEVADNRRALKGFLVARHRLMTERSASAVIGRRAMA